MKNIFFLGTTKLTTKETVINFLSELSELHINEWLFNNITPVAYWNFTLSGTYFSYYAEIAQNDIPLVVLTYGNVLRDIEGLVKLPWTDT